MNCILQSILSFLFSIIIFTAYPVFIQAGGASEESSSDRGAYVAEQGKIIPATEVTISSYIASVDYSYPDPREDLGINLYSGHKQISMEGQEELIQVGLQGRRISFEDLPVMNLAFVLDCSGSMSEKDKIEWAKEAFSLLLDRMRPQDILSVIIFAEKAEVILPSIRVGSITSWKELIAKVEAVIAEGPSNMHLGLESGYSQVLAAYKPEQVNRVLLISDGLGQGEKTEEIIRSYQRQGITLSTIAVGMNCDLNRMNELSKEGYGSSRFISNREKMEEIFRTDLDRMVVPLAFDLDMEITFAKGVEIIETWGYDHEISGNTIQYFLPALHHRDYETIIVQIRLPERSYSGNTEIAAFEITYTDRQGRRQATGSHSLTAEYTDMSTAQGGIANPIVLKAGTILHTAQKLEAIGFLYYSSYLETSRSYRTNNLIWQNFGVEQQSRIAELLAMEKEESPLSVRADKQRCLDLSESIKKEITNTHLRLGEDLFSQELTIAKKYIEILGKELNLNDQVISILLADQEPMNQEVKGSIGEQLETLVKELTMGLEVRPGGRIAFFGFTSGEGEPSSLQSTADRTVSNKLARLTNFKVIDSKDITDVLAMMEVEPSALLDNTVALKAGSLLGADLLLIGRILKMPNSTVVFGKMINQNTGDAESVAQIILRGDID